MVQRVSGQLRFGKFVCWGTTPVSEGLVYMRPLRLGGICVPTAGRDDVLHAWTRLNEWILRKSLVREIEIGYGLVGSDQDGFHYTACIELPDAVTRSEAEELSRASLQGGAYMRCRFQGPVGEICGKLAEMRDRMCSYEHMCRDEERPLVSVFLDVKNVNSGRDVRSNLLVPVCGAELSKSPLKAA